MDHFEVEPDPSPFSPLPAKWPAQQVDQERDSTEDGDSKSHTKLAEDPGFFSPIFKLAVIQPDHQDGAKSVSH
jgi:hypothetical protein